MLYNFHTHFRKKEGTEIFNLGDEIKMTETYFSIGIHPKDSEKEDFNELLLDQENCLAVGEIGLDKLISVPLEQQLKIFKNQISLSEKHELPVIIHCVKAWNELLATKKELKPKQKWIFHGFSKTSLIDEVLKNDLFIGIGTRILFDEKLQECLLKIPLDKILLETDADEKNSILCVYEKVALIKNISLQALENQIEDNFKSIFNKII